MIAAAVSGVKERGIKQMVNAECRMMNERQVISRQSPVISFSHLLMTDD
jgi:hypothetical protein